MHPNLTSHLLEARIAEMHRAADQNRRAEMARRSANGRPAGTIAAGIAPAAIRNRAGWTLVHLGLRLVSGSADG